MTKHDNFGNMHSSDAPGSHVEQEDWFYSCLPEHAIKSMQDHDERQYWLSAEQELEKRLQKELRFELVEALSHLDHYCTYHRQARKSHQVLKFHQRVASQFGKTTLDITEVGALADAIDYFVTTEHPWTDDEEADEIAWYWQARNYIVKENRRLIEFCKKYRINRGNSSLVRVRTLVDHKLKVRFSLNLSGNDAYEIEQAIDDFIYSHLEMLS